MSCIDLENETGIYNCLIFGFKNEIMLPNMCILYYGNRYKNYPLKQH